MSKRFVEYIIKHECIKVKDTVTGKIYNVYDEDKDVVDFLNTQQASIDKLQANIQYLIDSKKDLLEKIVELEEENEQLKTKGLELLNFYERKLLDAYMTEDYQTVNDQVSLVRCILYEIGVLKE